MPAEDPTLVLALPSGSDEIVLSWVDNAPAEDGYVVEFRSYTGTWGSGSWSGWAAVSASPLAADADSHTEGSLSAHTAYQFRVKATDAVNGDSAYVESNQTFTLPVVSGRYHAAGGLESTEWDRVILTTGAGGFLDVNLVTKDFLTIQKDVDPSSLIWGPEITEPSYNI